MKKFLFALLALCFTKYSFAVYYQKDDNKHGTWAGVEVIGVDTTTAASIRRLLPIKEGQPARMKTGEFKEWCKLVQQALPSHHVHCSTLEYLKGDTYYIIEINASNEDTNKFRTICTNSLKEHLAFPEVLSRLYDAFFKRDLDLFYDGIDSGEHDTQAGYLDFTDPILHQYAEQLIVLVPQYNATLLKIIEHSPNIEDRAKAATLLSWAHDPNNIHIIVQKNLLKDPDVTVRNNLARSMIRALSLVKDQETAAYALNAFCEQIQLPWNEDRNKGLSAIEKIIKMHPEAKNLFNNTCKEQIQQIAATSILENTGGIARNLVKYFNSEKHV